MVEIFKQFDKIQTEERIVDIDDFQKQNPDVVVLRDQLHGEKANYVSEYTDQLEGDGLFTDKVGLKLGVRTADCLPVLFYNPKIGVIGVVHAGWRGTETEVLKKTIQKVVEKWQTKPENFYFYFGPSAQRCCYDRDFLEKNLMQILDLGISREQIQINDSCTVHLSEFPSHSREGAERKSSILSIIERVA